jgi:soluble lytic murein transglycosylase-like protein
MALLCALLPQQSAADVYKFVDSSGHVIYTDKPRHSGFKLILSTPQPAFSVTSASLARGVTRARGLNNGYRRGTQISALHAQRRMEFSPLIDEAAYKYNIDPNLLHAVIRAESGYNPGAVSNKGAAGLMQLMPATANRFGVRDRFDPQDNIEGGARYLSALLDMFPYDLKLAVAAYNSGENAVKRHGNQIPPIAETQNYVEKVLDYYYR